MILLLFSLFLASVSGYNWTQPDPGRDCGPGESGTAGIKYYYDQQTDDILPFFYHGCGGNNNRYDSPNGVFIRPTGYFPCPGYPEPEGDCNSIQPPGQPKTCPSTAYCQMERPGYGKCCDSAAADRVAENRRAPQCSATLLHPVTETTSFGVRNLLGRNCSHRFCPEKSICYQGEFYAYCCKIMESTYNFIQPNLGRACNPGENGETPGIRYYVDREVNQAFPFFYRGCGGDSNRYNSRDRAPLLMDYAACPGYPLSITDCDTGRYPIIYSNHPIAISPPVPCPTTAYCRPVSPFGTNGKCCDRGAAERVGINRQAPECKAAGLSVVMEQRSWGAVHLLGRSCTHNFCPQGSSCRQGEFYAYCCQ